MPEAAPPRHRPPPGTRPPHFPATVSRTCIAGTILAVGAAVRERSADPSVASLGVTTRGFPVPAVCGMAGSTPGTRRGREQPMSDQPPNRPDAEQHQEARERSYAGPYET